MPRYFVDERGGCAAIRDSRKTEKEGNGLHSDMDSVVAYMSGIRLSTKCPHCHHESFDSWTLDPVILAGMYEDCEKLNQEDAAKSRTNYNDI